MYVKSLCVEECKVGYLEMLYKLSKIVCNNIKYCDSAQWIWNTNMRVECF